MTPTGALIPRGWPPARTRVVAAEGSELVTADGRRLLDGAAGALAVSVGYSVPEIAEAMAGQARRLSFAHSGHFQAEVCERYAAELAALMPGAGEAALARVLFATGGTEAIELAVQLAYRVHAARGETKRTILVGRHLSYHGGSLAALALGGRVSLRSLVQPLLAPLPHVPPPFPYRPEWHARFPGAVAGVPGLADVLERPFPRAAIDRGRADPVAALEVAFEHLGPERVAAFVAEPVIGASAGAVVPPEDYWPRVRALCDRYGVLLIADEVMCGFGRTGRWLALQQWGVQPDVVALGKGLGSAMAPLSAVLARRAHAEAVIGTAPGFPLGFTFANHPVAAAAGLATLEIFRREELLGRAAWIESELRRRLAPLEREHPYCGELRGRGAMLAIEIVADRDSRAPFPRTADATGVALRAAERRGVLLYPVRGCADGVRGDGFLIAPPLRASESDLDRVAEAVGAALDALPPR